MGVSTQARNRKYRPDETLANSFYFPSMLIKALRRTPGKYLRGKGEPEESRMRESLRYASGPRT